MMRIQITNEEVLEMGQVFGNIFLKIASLENILSNFTVEERLAGLTIEERLAGLTVEERLAGLTVEERLAGLDPNVIAAYLKRMQQAPPAINRN